METKTLNAILDGTYEMPLVNCELRQCGTGESIVYQGPGLLSQAADKSFQLRVFAGAVPELEAWKRAFRPLQLMAGELVPDSEYYDFNGIDHHGNQWIAHRLSIETSFGAGAYITAAVGVIEGKQSIGEVVPSSSVRAIVPAKIELPWHIATTTERRTAFDRFEGEDDHFAWALHDNERELELSFKVKSGAIEPHYKRFLVALSVLCGRSVDPVISEIVEQGHLITRLRTQKRPRWKATMTPPMRMQLPQAAHARAFLSSFITGIEHKEPHLVDNTQTVYGLWHRVLRAGENDIENSALVLSVAVEALLEKCFYSDADVDEEFVEQVEHAKGLLSKAGFMERALKRIEASLSGAVKPGPKQVLRRIEKQGFIYARHIEAWGKLRNKSAHGESISDADKALQKHLTRYHHCLGLFYLLIFIVIRYRGGYADFTSANWPDAVFDGSSV